MRAPVPDLFAPKGCAALARLLAGPAVFGFDFDGTLAPIRPTPGEVAMDGRTAAAFAALSARLPAAVITGRSLADVRPRLAGTPRWVVGNHGAEGMPDADPAILAAQAATCAAWRAQLEALGPAGAGIDLEDKRYTLSVHYRQAPDREVARRLIATRLPLLVPAPQVVGGKCVFNLLPAGSTDKFGALRCLAHHAGAANALFVGDDDNDEIVFRRAPPSWVTVKVGDGPTAARFRLRGQDAMADCLELLLKLLPGSDAGAATGAGSGDAARPLPRP